MVAQDRCEAGALGAPAVRFENVTLGYGNRTVLSGLNFQLGKGGGGESVFHGLTQAVHTVPRVGVF